LRQEVHDLLELGEQANQGTLRLPDGLVVEDEIAIRKEWLSNLAEARKVLEARAQERYAAEKAAYKAKLTNKKKRRVVPDANPVGGLYSRPQRGHKTKISTTSPTLIHAS